MVMSVEALRLKRGSADSGLGVDEVAKKSAEPLGLYGVELLA